MPILPHNNLEFKMVFISLNAEIKTPLFQQVFNQLKDKIDKQLLPPGYKLPSTRSLAQKLGVDRTTIYKAYQELWALGYIDSRSGSYSYVRQKRELCNTKQKIESSLIAWNTKVNDSAEKVYKMFGEINYPFSEKTVKFEGIDLGRLHPDIRLYPIEKFKSCLNKILLESGHQVLDYGNTLGHLPLRDFIARRQQMHGINTKTEEVIITNGAQNAIDLLMKLFAKPGARVFVESPTYGMIIPTLHYYQCEIVSIPMREDGVDLKIIEQELKKGKPIFFYTMPNFHNPTGITTSQKHRENLLALFESYGVPIIEDAFEEEMKYFGKVPLPIKSMDNNRIVIYVGSFSKILFPGIRLGWITADNEIIKRLASIKRFSDLTSALPEQAALAEFCAQGYYELQIKKIHKIYRKRMAAAVNVLSQRIQNKNVTWNQPNGGFTIWITLDNCHKNYSEVNNILLDSNVRFALGKDFFPHNEKNIFLRLSIASLNEDEITEGINRFAKSLNRIYEK
jgi:DNA-binding transcriptional MocR family regulator